MKDYLLLMHDDARGDAAAWPGYLEVLRRSGRFSGGSAIGGGICVRKSGDAAALTPRLSGYLRIKANDLDDARAFVAGNPVFEAGGTVEIRELPAD